MAILSDIRNRSGLLIIIIGLALFAFVASPKDIIDFFSNKDQDAIGNVNGDKISNREFASRVELMKNQQNNRAQGLQIENSVWDQLLREKLYDQKIEEAGIVIGESAIWQSIISNPQVTSSPQFQGSNGQFSEDALKAYVADLQDADTAEKKGRLQGWLNFEKNVKRNLAFQTYNDLIKSGLHVTGNELAANNQVSDTKVTADYVFVPFTTIPNADVKVTEAEVADYINNNAKEFKTEAKRNLKFVKFPFTASKQDEADIKNGLAALIEDKEEYNKVIKSTETVLGLKNTTDYKEFIAENDSDLPVNENLQFEKEIPSVVINEIKEAAIGTVVGPYKSSNYYKLTKLAGVKQIPDSVQASHILIPFAGSLRAEANVTRTADEARIFADSLMTVIKKSPRKLEDLAKTYSSDSGSGAKGGDLGWFTYNQMVPAFRDFSFLNKRGDIGVVESQFGFHVIKIFGQKNIQKAYQLVTIAKKVVASEETENAIFEKAETFSQAVQSGKDFSALAQEQKLTVLNANEIKELDVYAGSLGQNRSVVRWSFDEDTALNEVKRFDLDENGYAVVTLSGVQEKGTANAKFAFSKVEPILVAQKKAALINEKMTGASLEEIAKANKVQVANFKNVTISAPTIPSVGIEPNVVCKAVSLTPNTLIKKVVGKKGVFAIVTKEVVKPELKADVATTQVNSTLKNYTVSQLFEGLKDQAEIVDSRAERF